MKTRWGVVLLIAALLAACAPALAHNVAAKDAEFLKQNPGAQIVPYIYLGAKHMVTGYDHLLFLFGVIFFLYRLKDVAVYVTCFAVGHSITLLTGVLTGLHLNPYIVDTIIGLSVVYKAFDNLDGFRTLFGFQPNTKLTVLLFGLFHGFGLATKLQELNLSKEGLIRNMISFNVGVEIGQLIALSVILFFMTWWRSTPDFSKHAVLANVVVMTAGFVLMGYQLGGYYVDKHAPAQAASSGAMGKVDSLHRGADADGAPAASQSRVWAVASEVRTLEENR